MSAAVVITAPYEVGRFYPVPTVHAEYFEVVRHWPVLLPLHDDAEVIRFDRPHYHIDRRFLTEGDLARWSRSLISAPLIDHRHFPMGPVVMRHRKCRRNDIGPGTAAAFSSAPFFKPLEAHLAGARMKGLRCPHRGADLSRECVHDGVVTCLLHGLSWRIDGGELVPAEVALAAHVATARAA